ncbi:ALI_HP2_G0046940.mRNA.1.CDS.1 [Saccharomyces cerevisiae]|nr:ALI_HP2_G0046940.mRNA.1.CDS.1 [Saccharomyces cerevisiae]CAI6748237.1 ALI_HP2_G0046940.mRNA.1.CDS.1 [Saccharomyces cerevisiae]CAI6760499.1 ALI_HP1_G0047700.mRNA.1.CDS.1 [Saccharomyces cerevisiae]CAI6878026.1 ALI_collapsed_G0049240.mRNA.1.CDS.1 [Saccharomyces cerevisiae]
MDSVIQKRIFVGNIFHNADDCYSELLDRFGKFGDCQDFQFEKHNHFAFIDIRFNDEADFNKLRKSFNNVKFKGNILKVDEAKPNWETTWAVQHAKDLKEDIILNAKMKKKNWQHYKKMENVAKSWKDHKEVIAGRMREVPRKRSQLRNITFRINVNGSLKVYKCYKTKLWGYERNKELNDLVYKFTNNFWKNGYNHIVDRLDYSRAVKTVRFKNGLKQLTVSKDENVCSGEMDSDENMSEEEKEKNNVILNDLLKDFDFDKPMTLNDSDEELLTEQRKGEEEEEEEEKEVNAPEYENVKMENPSEVNKTEDQSTLPQEKPEERKEQDEGDGQEDNEFIPTFTKEIGQGTISNTETLRNLFNPNEAEPVSQFKLIEDSDNDIDHAKDVDVNQLEEEVSKSDTLGLTSAPVPHVSRDKDNKNFLFFPHLQSPFLVGQTQLSKVRAPGRETMLSNWDEDFWANRGNWTRDMRRKMKDALKHRKRKQSKSGLLL